MAKKKNSKIFDGDDYISLPTLDLHPDIKKGITVIIIFALGAISLLSLFNLGGQLGVYLAKGILLLFGWGEWLFPFVLMALAFLIYSNSRKLKGATYLGLFLFVVSFQSLLHLVMAFSLDITPASIAADGAKLELWRSTVDAGTGGGYTGLFLSSAFLKLLGFWGGMIAVLGILLIALMLVFNTTLSGLIGRASWFAKAIVFINRLFHSVYNKLFGADAEEKIEEEIAEEEPPVIEEEASEPIETGFVAKELGEEKAKEASPAKTKKAKQVELELNWKPSHVAIDLPLDLLSGKIGKPTSGDIQANMEIIKAKLEFFGIPVEMGEVSVGPTVTQYTFKPAQDVKLSSITALNNDLALALAAHPIRIEAPIPGKSLVGIEVPNKAKAIVGLREILSDKVFKERKNNMLIALGKDVSGTALMEDLSRMPHLLVAGATNSGKSVCLNTIIVSLLYQNNPDDLKFIMVDPKKVELPMYNGIPHLLTPTITDVTKTVNALKWCLNEMDRRFEILAEAGKKNIQTYNEGKRDGERMPFIIFIIDELADLMVVAAREVEPCIIRLAQMARAVGIHLVLATQRPSVNVITGVIKANMPARIAFSVASGIDSRTILDSLGAEKLLGRGDMLFSNPETPKPKRIQGAYLSEEEINKIVRYIKNKSEGPNYVEGVTERQKVSGIAGVGMEGNPESEDELFQEAKETIINSGKASTTFLQRKLGIGYARAAKLLDALEENGVVGPANGAKPREILITREQYDNMISQGVSGVSLHKMEESEAPESYLGTEEDKEAEDENAGEDFSEAEEDEEQAEREFEAEVDTPEVRADIANDGELPVHAELKKEKKPKKPEEAKEDIEPDDFEDGKFFSR